MDWLKTIAPLLGTAIAGPLGGIAASAIAAKLGLPSDTVDAVSKVLTSGKMTADQITQLKLAEIEFQKFLETNQIDLEKVHASDRQSARSMLSATKSYIPASLSVLVTLGYFGILIGMMRDMLHVSDSQALLLMLGSLSTAWGMVMAFWFGTTKGSSDKNEILALRDSQSVPNRRKDG